MSIYQIIITFVLNDGSVYNIRIFTILTIFICIFGRFLYTDIKYLLLMYIIMIIFIIIR